MKHLLLFCLLSLPFLSALAQQSVTKPVNTGFLNRPIDTVYMAPAFPGGEMALVNYLQEQLKNVDLTGKPDGISYLDFIVTKDGAIKDVQVSKSLDPTLDKAAVKAVKAMPRWNPGSSGGKVADVRYTLPVKFSKESQTLTKEKSKP